MADITIERLEITVELDGEGADLHFARLFDHHVRRWWATEQAREADRRFAERERLLPDSLRGPRGASP
jgi:hypothetical protein